MVLALALYIAYVVPSKQNALMEVQDALMEAHIDNELIEAMEFQYLMSEAKEMKLVMELKHMLELLRSEHLPSHYGTTLLSVRENHTSKPLLPVTVNEEGSVSKPTSPQEPPGRPLLVHKYVEHLQNNYSRLSSSVTTSSQALSHYTLSLLKHHHQSSTISSEEMNDAESAYINISSNCSVTSDLYEAKDESTECFLRNKIA